MVTYKTEELNDSFKRFDSAMQSYNGNEMTLNWVVVFSPQGTKEITQYLSVNHRLLDSNLRIASIGPTTQQYLEDSNITSDIVSPKPDPKSLLHAIEVYQRSK